MVEVDFKHDYWATREDALRLLKRVHRIAEPLGYNTTVYGSSIVKGGGHDVDMTLVGLGAETESSLPHELAFLLIEKLATRIFLFEQIDVGDVSDVYVIMLVRDRGEEVMLDLHVKGDAGQG